MKTNAIGQGVPSKCAERGQHQDERQERFLLRVELPLPGLARSRWPYWRRASLPHNHCRIFLHKHVCFSSCLSNGSLDGLHQTYLANKSLPENAASQVIKY
jgi:hypothetical protein